MSQNKLFPGQPLFSQILSLIPKEIVKEFALKYDSDRYCRRFFTQDHQICAHPRHLRENFQIPTILPIFKQNTSMRSWLILALSLLGLQIFAQDAIHLASVLKQLGLKRDQCKMDLVVAQIHPSNPGETIIVIPEIVEDNEYYGEFHTHILILDKQSGKIKQRFFESSETNEWYSDAIRLVEITIDSTNYALTDNQNAFGIRVRYLGSSHANPYEKENLSLYTEDGVILKQILKNLMVLEYSGKWDTDCAGEFDEQNSILIMNRNEGQSYADILLKTSFTFSQAFLNKAGDCLVEETNSEESRLLKFVNGVYK